MVTSHVAVSLSEQYHGVWNNLRDALSRLDDEQFLASDIEWLIPRNLAYHVAETADFYSSDCESEDFSWGHFTVENKAQMLAYIEQVEAKMKRWLMKHSDEDFFQPQTICQWTGDTLLDRAIYALRHTQHHTAQINSELRRRGLPRGEWQ